MCGAFFHMLRNQAHSCLGSFASGLTAPCSRVALLTTSSEQPTFHHMMCSEAHEATKHFNMEDRRRRYDTGSKYGGYAGQSLVRAMPDPRIDGFKDIHVKINRPSDEDGNVLVSELELEVPDIQNAADVMGGDAFHLPELLEELCTSKSIKRDQECPSVVVTTYVLDGIGRLAPTDDQRLAMLAKRDVRLTLLKHRADAQGCRVFCRYDDAPSAELSGRCLLDHRAKLSVSGGHRCFGRVFEEHCRHSCFAQSDRTGVEAGGIDLFVDLGETCLVTHVSTQGRFPQIHGVDKESGSRIVSDSWQSQSWVASYELSFRRQSGKAWISLGVLKGNSDMTTEVVHALENFGHVSGAVQCRHLRFRPLEVHVHPSMRVGVYGVRPNSAQSWHQPVADDLSDSVVQYSVSSMIPQQNCRRVPVGRSHCRLGCAICSKKRGCKAKPRCNRRAASEQLWKEGLEELGFEWGRSAERCVGDDVQDLELCATAISGTPQGSDASSAPSVASPVSSLMDDSLVFVKSDEWQLI